MNRVILVGRVGKDPQLKTLNSGGTVLNLSVATTKELKNKEGKITYIPVWHQVVFWNVQAERVASGVKKGDLVFVEGEIDYQSWEDKATNKVLTKTVIQATQVYFLPRAVENSKYDPAATGGYTSDDIPF